MLNYSTCRLITMIALKHLNGLNLVWEEEVVFKRIYELEEEYDKVQEIQELKTEYTKLFEQFFEIDDQNEQQDALFEFDSLMGSELTAAKKFYYQAGVNDVLQIFNGS